jgi:hypothetical protein
VIDRKLLALLFIVVAVFASMEVRPRTLVLSIVMSEDSPSPLNEGELGSSMFARVLEEAGFRVVVVPGAAELAGALSRYDRVVLVVIGSDYLTEEAGRATARVLESYAGGEDKWLGVLIADEAPGDGAKEILLAAQRVVCGGTALWIGDAFSSPATVAEFYLAETPLRVVTGYTAPVYSPQLGGVGYAVVPPGAPTPVPSPAEAGGDARIIGYAWPSTEAPRGLWYPIAGYCEGGGEARGRVVVVGDSTMFLNSSLESGEAVKAAVGLVRLAAGGEDAVVVFVQEHYVSGEELRSVVVKILPSVLLIALASAYSSVEEGILSAIAASGPLAAAFTASLAFIAWALMPVFQERERVKDTGRPSLRARARTWVLRLRRLLRPAS